MAKSNIDELQLDNDKLYDSSGNSVLVSGLRKGIVTIPMSFQTSEFTTTKIYFPIAVTITKIRSIVMLAIAGTDAGTITCANATGASTGGVVTVAASSALNVEDSATPTTNNTTPSTHEPHPQPPTVIPAQ